MNDDELCYMSATEALANFQSGTLSPVELIKSIIHRAEAIQEKINPFADQYFDEAMNAAKVAETKYHNSSDLLGRLEGLPLAVKDSTPVQGRRSSNGSLINASQIDHLSNPSIERLLTSGANLFARTTCPEFCWLFSCHSRMWGITRNPWRLDITPGGSSGGSAAALAAGATTIATGSDSAGSIRQPASQCGIVGYKPPYGRMPLSPSNSFDPYVQIGPMARTVSDTALMSNVMSGPHALDHTSLPEKLSIPDRLQGINGMKLAFSTDLGHYELANDVEREFLASIQSLSNTGAKLEEVPLDGLSEIIRLSHGAQEFLAHGFLKDAVENHSDMISDYVPELLETALKYDVEDYQRSKLLAGEIWQNQLGPIFQKYDALICPTVSSPMVPAENWQTHKILLNDRQLTDTEMTMTALFNLFSRCPVLAVPSGMTNDGLPCGLQIVGRPCDDITVFRIGAAFEVVRPWMKLDKIQPSWDLIHKNNKWSEIRMGETDEQ